MKKITFTKFILLLFLLSIAEKDYAQIGVGEAVTTPIASPSMTAMSTYTDVPMSIATGNPEIGLPLFSAPLYGGINWPLHLSYNVRNIRDFDTTTSDVGNGWSFFGAGVIYKKTIFELDECYDNTGAVYYKNNEFDDVYYYNIPDLSGKFRIKRDTVTNTFQLINLTPNNAKIEYVRNSNTVTFKADSFSITSDTGYKYIFDVTDMGRYPCSDYLLVGTEYKPSYYLSKILNPIGVEVASMEYDEKKNYKPSTTLLLSIQHKLKSITSRNGKVVFDYLYDDTLEPKKNTETMVSDPYSLQKITLKNPAGNDIFSYVFNYTMVSKGNAASNKVRILNSVVKKDKDGAIFENNSFVYESPTGEGKLKKMVSPTGAVTEYNYETGDIYFNYNDPEYLAYLATLNTIQNPNIQHWVITSTTAINTTQNLMYNITIPGNTAVKKNFKLSLNLEEYFYPEPIPGFPEKPHNLKITIKRGSEVIIPTITTSSSFGHDYMVNNFPGIYTVEITSTGGATGSGDITASEIQLKPGPYRNASPAGLRINNIKTYKNISDTSPARTIHYEYDSFDLPNSSSGYAYESERDSDSDDMGEYILYRNVKESEAGKGSVRYIFKIPDDYPKQQTGGTALEPRYFWPYFAVTKGGLISKKEIYDEQNALLTAELNAYELDNYSDQDYNLNWSIHTITSKPSYIKKKTITNKTYLQDNGILESISETSIQLSNMKPYYIKNVADGDISEQFITYAIGQTGYGHLENASMTGIPIIQEEKKNGKTLSKAVTRYENSSLLPTSIYAANISDGSLKLKGKMDAYDDKGNVVQASSGTGTPTTFIYGYNKTQLIAKIAGATYDDVKTNALVVAAVTASDNDNTNPATESDLVTALENLRTHSSMAGYQITTYTYDPLVGLTTTTSPNGQREIYEYDSAGRLKRVKSAERNNAGAIVEKTLKEYQYHYKP